MDKANTRIEQMLNRLLSPVESSYHLMRKLAKKTHQDAGEDNEEIFNIHPRTKTLFCKKIHC